ncbi:MAG: S9 family peptidase [Ignavibacteria bacterium]|nr:S9 family peptidase [Ignavibacteria bacterium]
MTKILVAALLPVLLPVSLPAQEGTAEWTLEEIFSSQTFLTKSLPSVQWVGGAKALSYVEFDSSDGSKDIMLYDIAAGTQRRVFDGSLLNGDSTGFVMSEYSWAPDHRSILLTGSHVARRRKTGGNFALFDTTTQELSLMTTSDEPQSIIKFSPDGRRIGFVRSNNLFMIDVNTGAETQLTRDGSDTVINGMFDWVYEEEFSIIDAWEWSPDSRFIAFWRFDQSGVPTYPIVRYPDGDVHPTLEVTRYPKAGDPVSVVRIGVIDTEELFTTWIDIGEEVDQYIPRIHWTNSPGILAVQRLNRSQDTLQLMLADVSDGSSRVVLTETDPAWIDAEDGMIEFLKESDRFIWSSFRDGYNHLYLYTLDGELERQLTSGPWEVTEYHGTDERRGVVYFTSTRQSPVERHLYRIGLDGRRMKRLTDEPGWHSSSFAPGMLAFLDTYSRIDEPLSVTLRSNEGEEVAVLVENTMDQFTGRRFGRHTFVKIPAGDGELLNGWMLTPPDFDQSRRYPVLLYVYGGPGSQIIRNQWGGSRFLWYQLLAEKGYIIAAIDNRGTGGRGKTFMQQTFRQMGLKELDDCVETARYLKSLSYVDSTRLGIWGWSWGGYLTTLAMTRAPGTFRAGMAVGPVTDWSLYDAVYTERYMGTPENNRDGYRETSAIRHAGLMTGNLLVVHGLADDNVHWQNSVLLVEALVRANRQVTVMFYPERRHSLTGNNGILHVYTLLTDYLLKNL